jgi:hypothetical protein
MKIDLNKAYETLSHNKAVVTYRQPADVVDEFPLIGHVVNEGKKLGVRWSVDGLAGESLAFDLIGEWASDAG